MGSPVWKLGSGPPGGHLCSHTPDTQPVCQCLSSRAADFSPEGPDWSLSETLPCSCSTSGPSPCVNDGAWQCSDKTLFKKTVCRPSSRTVQKANTLS